MASAAPPITGASASIPERYALPADLPTLPSVDVTREPLEPFKLAVAKLIGDAWEEDALKIYTGVDAGTLLTLLTLH
jgi:arginyl-tRNA synthetase